jgi:hypothetical protein
MSAPHLAIRLIWRVCECGHFDVIDHSRAGLCDLCECETFAPVRLCGGAWTPEEERDSYFSAMAGR